MGSVMQKGEFANQQALQDYADAHGLAYVWEGMNAFAKRWHLAQLAQPGTYELVEVRTRRGMTKASRCAGLPQLGRVPPSAYFPGRYKGSRQM